MIRKITILLLVLFLLGVRGAAAQASSFTYTYGEFSGTLDAFERTENVAVVLELIEKIKEKTNLSAALIVIQERYAWESGGSYPSDLLLHGYLYIARQLIEKGADVNYADDYMNTPLHHAVREGVICGGDAEMVKLLLTSGANVDASNRMGDTSLHMLFPTGHIEGRSINPDRIHAIAQLLLQYGADMYAVNNSEQSPLTQSLFMAQYNGLGEDLLILFVGAGADVNELMKMALQSDNRKAEEVLLKLGAETGSRYYISSFIYKRAVELKILFGLLMIFAGVRYSNYFPQKGSKRWVWLTAATLVVALINYYFFAGGELSIFLYFFVPPLVIAGIAGFKGLVGYYLFSTASLLVAISLTNYFSRMLSAALGSGEHDIHFIIMFMVIVLVTVFLGLLGLVVQKLKKSPARF